MMTCTEFDIKKINENNDFGLWQVRMKALLEQQGLATGGVTCSHNCDLAVIDTLILDEDQAFLLLTSLPSSYDNLVETLLYGHDTLKLEDEEIWSDEYGAGYISAWSKSQGKSSRFKCYICQSEEHLKRDCPRVVTKKEGIEFAREYGCLFIECSEKTQVNVEQCFEELILKITNRRTGFMDFDYAMGRSITSGVYDTYGGYEGGYLAKGTRNIVRIRIKDSSGYCYRCLVKGYPWSEVLVFNVSIAEGASVQSVLTQGFFEEDTSKEFLVGQSFSGEVRMTSLLEQQGLAAGGVTCDLAAIDTAISDEDQAFLLLTSLPSSYDNLMTEAKGDGGEGLYVRRRSGQMDMKQGIITKNLKVVSVLKIMYPVLELMEYGGGNILLGGDGKECHVRGTGKVQVHMRDGSSIVLDNVGYVLELRQNMISLGTLEKKGFSVKMQSGKIKVIKGSLVVLSGTRRDNCVYTLDGQALIRKTLKGRKQLGEYQTGWKIKKGETTMSTYLVNKVTIISDWVYDAYRYVVLYGNMGFNKSKEYKKTFIESGVDTSSVQVLKGVEFEVKPQVKVEPHGNVDHVVSSQEVQTQDLIYYHPVLAAVEKIYAHKSMTLNNIVACEVIFKWKAGLKNDMDARSYVYVLSNGCRKCSDEAMAITESIHQATKGLLDKAKGNVLGMHIVKDRSGNTPRVSQSSFYNGKLVQTLLEGHSILSLKGSLSGDCDLENNDVGMLDKFDRGLQTDVHAFVDFDYAMGRSITSGVNDTYGCCEGGYLSKGTRNRVRIRAKDSSGYCYRCLVKGYHWSDVPT
uniref:Zinc finger, CCHC-type n=1 Tax=Tanacetum cinerariifolium TaxID=118510 RepID=A0A6L2KAV1_TANCI|nr:zinc finger, CCHC-type [Tanacetum cinerariifolium]